MRLFRPAWDSKNEKRAVKAVEKSTGQTALMATAKNDVNEPLKKNIQNEETNF